VQYAGATLQVEVVDRRQTPSLVGGDGLVLGRGLQAEPVRSRRGAVERERKGPKRLGWKITSGVLTAATVGLAANSVHNRNLVDRNTTPTAVSRAWEISRTSGALAWTAGGAAGTTFLISVL